MTNPQRDLRAFAAVSFGWICDTQAPTLDRGYLSRIGLLLYCLSLTLKWAETVLLIFKNLGISTVYPILPVLCTVIQDVFWAGD